MDGEHVGAEIEISGTLHHQRHQPSPSATLAVAFVNLARCITGLPPAPTLPAPLYVGDLRLTREGDRVIELNRRCKRRHVASTNASNGDRCLGLDSLV